jgi:alcohol dehydrogenase class IV
MSNQILLPEILQIGAGAIENVAEVLLSCGCQYPCIITDPMIIELGYVDRLKKILARKNIPCGIFSDTVPEPTDISITPAVETICSDSYDSIIAIGGGSAIDSAKAISILAKFGGVMRDYKAPKDIDASGLPVIAIPTTAGTGSETTRFTIITDASNDEKMLCMGRGFMPAAAIIDYQLTLTLPPRITADSGIDALTHAIESYVSQKANPFSDQQAIAAIKLIAPNLRIAYHEPDNIKAREAMTLGATLAGIAFSNASVALVHAMSRPIGAHFHVPHGLSNAMLLPTVIEFSLMGSPERFAECARLMGLCEPDDDELTAHRKLIDELGAINKELQVPTPELFGIDKKHYDALLPLMAQQAMDSGSANNNPKVPSISEIIELYKMAWK